MRSKGVDIARGVGAYALPRVTIIRPMPGNLGLALPLIGNLVARSEVLVSGDGVVDAVLVREGAHVHGGQVLARLRRDLLDAELAEREASLGHAAAAEAEAGDAIDESRARLVEAGRALARSAQLIRIGEESSQTYDDRVRDAHVAAARLSTAQDTLRAAQADVGIAKAQLETLRVRIARSELTSPVDGLVIERSVEIGQVAALGGSPLFRIARDGALDMLADVPQSALPALAPGQHVRVEVDGRVLPGVVELILPKVDGGTGLGHARIALGADAADQVMYGSFARATVQTTRQAGLLIPLSSLQFHDGVAEVKLAVRTQSGFVVQRASVTVGAQDGGWAEIEAGLRQGDRVVAVSGALLHEGDRIIPVVGSSMSDL